MRLLYTLQVHCECGVCSIVVHARRAESRIPTNGARACRRRGAYYRTYATFFPLMVRVFSRVSCRKCLEGRAPTAGVYCEVILKGSECKDSMTCDYSDCGKNKSWGARPVRLCTHIGVWTRVWRAEGTNYSVY